ncbi:hypothetical protein SELMODRAFT_147110 [Selaginella moellendorffii]|uniref:Glutathione S-transferase 3, mitochondrial n=1 Tax=Selaginella moellendorffii TaxID=88036 RepID=D8RGZ5_SELML|nr:microsomal glutathione S-transferase 3 [Selaginella moellendorffii]EFJ28449.1 hypothetical protein SELMODRAFT_147110 [Selaginella moellendorffii]|eukprot:XP_002970319.1 microsomal glutathione S-transferase 3 [Selaginella moellendorffii]
MATVELSSSYGFVVLIVVAKFVLNVWMMLQVGKARKRYKVPYPTLYALESENKEAKLFNCVQRGHQNTLELMPLFLTLLLLGGLKYPIVAALFGALYIVTRYFYFTGYSTGIPDNRLSIGKFSFIGLLGLLVCTFLFGIGLLF